MLPDELLLKANNDTRIRSRDMFMIMALWMEYYPRSPSKTLFSVRQTGCVLVDPRDRILSLESTGESHAIVRAILKSPVDPASCDIYVSRFPCSLCTKMMVQAGIRKIYYFPAKGLEIDWNDYCLRRDRDASSPTRQPMTMAERVEQKKTNNINSVSRLVANNPIAMSKFIPIWTSRSDLTTEDGHDFELWTIDDSVANSPPFLKAGSPSLISQFDTTIHAINLLRKRYSNSLSKIRGIEQSLGLDGIWQHAIVLAHIAAKRTDDAKVGVGAVLVYPDGTYGSVGWNGYPKKADILDYPQAGADDFIDYNSQELKYDYILHAEQNALLWRMHPGKSLEGCTVVSTKMPCDECSPVLHDCGVTRVVANVQLAKSPDDPARLRGLTYDKIEKLMDSIWVF